MVGSGSGTKLAALANLARVQHGLFTVADMKSLFLSSGTIVRQVRDGLVQRVGPSTYRFTAAPQSFESKVHGVALSVDGVVSHLSAAQLWGLGRIGTQNDVHVTITPDRMVAAISRPKRGVYVHRRALPESDVVVRSGMRVTTVARTLRDIAWLVDPRSRSRIEWYWRLIDDALDASLVKLGDLKAIFDITNPRCPYSKAFRIAVARRVGAWGSSESVLERQFLREARKRGWAVETQVRFEWRQNAFARSDAVVRAAKLIVELDGRRGHSSLSDRDADRRRDLEALSNGWATVRIGWNEFNNNRERVMSDLDDLIRQRGSPVLPHASGVV